MARSSPRLSGTVFACLPGARDISLIRSHGIDFNQFPTFGGVTGAEEIKAVRHRKMRRAVRTLTLLIDSASLPLNALSRGWARFPDKARAAKLHIVYDPNADCPAHTALTTASVNGITAANAMPHHVQEPCRTAVGSSGG